MPKGISIHIGLNYINVAHYGTNGALPYCTNDAAEMRRIAIAEGYEVQSFLINDSATTVNVSYALQNAADKLHSGDILLLTYSGHGSYFPDQNGDEEDKYDETWVLYDRMYIDDELYYAWSKFRKGVRIILVADSCHSGTMAKPFIAAQAMHFTRRDDIKVPEKTALISMLKSEATQVYKKHKEDYDAHLNFIPSPNDIKIRASIILLAASKDNELAGGVSRSGRELSLFTDELLTVYIEKTAGLSYLSFLKEIQKRIPKDLVQTPNYFKTGVANNAFTKQKPFKI